MTKRNQWRVWDAPIKSGRAEAIEGPPTQPAISPAEIAEIWELVREPPSHHCVGRQCRTALPRLLDEVERLNNELRYVAEVRQPGTCRCSDDDACRFARERDDALARAEKVEQALVLIGERAVVDWDDKTVGEVDAAIADRRKYRDWLKDVMTKALRAEKAEAEYDALKAEVERLRSIEEAAKAWESAKPGHIDEDTAFDYAAVARAILAGYGPEGKVKHRVH